MMQIYSAQIIKYGKDNQILYHSCIYSFTFSQDYVRKTIIENYEEFVKSGNIYGTMEWKSKNNNVIVTCPFDALNFPMGYEMSVNLKLDPQIKNYKFSQILEDGDDIFNTSNWIFNIPIYKYPIAHGISKKMTIEDIGHLKVLNVIPTVCEIQNVDFYYVPCGYYVTHKNSNRMIFYTVATGFRYQI